MPRRGIAALAAYIAAIFAANWLTSRFGQVHLPGMALEVTAGTYAAGAALLLRDVVQEACRAWWVWVGIAAGALLTALTSPSLAFASTAAFVVAEALDMAVYTPLRKHGWARAALASGCVGAVVDTVVFLHLAHFPLTWSSVAGQLVGKAFWATALPVAVFVVVRQVRRGPVLRDSVNA
ncbi:VUT family protein [Streptomyces sp. NPDC006172]|uniref:VUT family protein n=1 Tax=Streptomyces sp. NPDC006172 TaxID=3154470 RepID=UPI0033C5F968